MRKLVLLAAIAIAGVAAQSAAAGCWATVGVTPRPAGLQAGEKWRVTVRVLQHGYRPLAGAKPEVRISGEGMKRVFRARPLAKRGSYAAVVVFPRAGIWRYTVYDGFVPNCAQEHTFAPFVVAPADPV
jgi:hypothetical protein